MKTEQEINDLKSAWLYDPIWDIEDSTGFEDHFDELLAWRLKQKRIDEKCKELSCSPALLEYIEKLEFQIDALKRALEKIEN